MPLSLIVLSLVRPLRGAPVDKVKSRRAVTSSHILSGSAASCCGAKYEGVLLSRKVWLGLIKYRRFVVPCSALPLSPVLCQTVV